MPSSQCGAEAAAPSSQCGAEAAAPSSQCGAEAAAPSSQGGAEAAAPSSQCGIGSRFPVKIGQEVQRRRRAVAAMSQRLVIDSTAGYRWRLHTLRMTPQCRAARMALQASRYEDGGTGPTLRGWHCQPHTLRMTPQSSCCEDGAAALAAPQTRVRV